MRKTYKQLMEIKIDILERKLRKLENIREEQKKVRDEVEFLGGEVKQIIKRTKENDTNTNS